MSRAVRTEFERPPGAECDPPAGVEGHLTAFERRGQRGGGAAAKSTHAGHELGEVKGLRQVAVGAQPEAVHPLSDGTGRSQHQHPAPGPPGHGPSADFVAAGSGQVPVQHHDVIAGDGQMVERAVPVEDHVDRHALPAQSGPDRRGQDLEIFNDQHSHDLLVILLDSLGSAQLRAGRV
jgi:hypothetical protein